MNNGNTFLVISLVIIWVIIADKLEIEGFARHLVSGLIGVVTALLGFGVLN